MVRACRQGGIPEARKAEVSALIGVQHCERTDEQKLSINNEQEEVTEHLAA